MWFQAGTNACFTMLRVAERPFSNRMTELAHIVIPPSKKTEMKGYIMRYSTQFFALGLFLVMAQMGYGQDIPGKWGRQRSEADKSSITKVSDHGTKNQQAIKKTTHKGSDTNEEAKVREIVTTYLKDVVRLKREFKINRIEGASRFIRSYISINDDNYVISVDRQTSRVVYSSLPL